MNMENIKKNEIYITILVFYKAISHLLLSHVEKM